MSSALFAEQLVETIDFVEHDFTSILRLAELAIAAMAADDPLREDVVEIRRAAERAIVTTGKFVEQAACVGRPSFVAILQAR